MKKEKCTPIYYEYLTNIREHTSLLRLRQPQTSQANREGEGSLEGRKLA